MRLRHRLIYGAASYALIPLLALALIARGWRDRGYWHAFGERLGWGRRIGRTSIWVHAVSVGEIQAASTLLRELLRRHPSTPIVLTCATPTGAARARELFKDELDVRFAPFDLPGAARRFLARVQPRLAIIMETEIWPNLFDACRKRGVPIILASARLSVRSVRRYRRFPGLFADTLGEGVTIAAQSAADAERFAAIGAPWSRIKVAGNLKFDISLAPDVHRRGDEIRAQLGGAARQVWIAGSTHAGEEQILLDAHRALLRAEAGALLVLAPRHPPRFAQVAAWLEREAVPFTRASAPSGGAPPAPVLLLDSLGELVNYYAAGDVAFVGGTLVPVGGHNPLEPAAIGMPLLCGPYYANSKEASELLIGCGALEVVHAAGELTRRLESLLADPGERERRAAAGRATIECNRGALERLLELIEPRPTRA
jgi:3-deoxy-D-manno-octulosonic-acid transferase